MYSAATADCAIVLVRLCNRQHTRKRESISYLSLPPTRQGLTQGVFFIVGDLEKEEA